MSERSILFPREVKSKPGPLSYRNVLTLQCLIDGWTGREVLRMGLDFETEKKDVISKTQNNHELEEFLGEVHRLPFTAPGFLSQSESVVAFLDSAGFTASEINENLGVDRQTVYTFKRRIKAKKKVEKDRDVPQGVAINDGTRLAMVKGIYLGLKESSLNMELLNGEPTRLLSYNESRVLFLMCRGLSNPEIAQTLVKKEATVSTFAKKVAEKLEVRKKYGLVAKGLQEMMRDLSKS